MTLSSSKKVRSRRSVILLDNFAMWLVIDMGKKLDAMSNALLSAFLMKMIFEVPYGLIDLVRFILTWSRTAKLVFGPQFCNSLRWMRSLSNKLRLTISKAFSSSVSVHSSCQISNVSSCNGIRTSVCR